MKQMVNKNVPGHTTELGELKDFSFFRLDDSGEIFMRGVALCFFVLEDGRICLLEPLAIGHDKVVERVDPKMLGINSIMRVASRPSP
ncbi:MAG: hypothetical protein NTW11_03020 [Candidatus Staskawiczbacteria bacterium]|nr:hypothetical protein [Candidatus Staskawiczbacteria bacterium]